MAPPRKKPPPKKKAPARKKKKTGGTNDPGFRGVQELKKEEDAAAARTILEQLCEHRGVCRVVEEYRYVYERFTGSLRYHFPVSASASYVVTLAFTHPSQAPRSFVTPPTFRVPAFVVIDNATRTFLLF
jgi:hypothetical protein